MPFGCGGAALGLCGLRSAVSVVRHGEVHRPTNRTIFKLELDNLRKYGMARAAMKTRNGNAPRGSATSGMSRSAYRMEAGASTLPVDGRA